VKFSIPSANVKGVTRKTPVKIPNVMYAVRILLGSILRYLPPREFKTSIFVFHTSILALNKILPF
jgi:hypothetical protein